MMHKTPALALLALLAGGATTLSFAPFGWYPLAILGPALLFRLWHGASTRQGLLYGWCFGLGLFGTGVHWVYASISVYGNLGVPLAVLITLLFVLILSLYPAALGFLLARFGGGGRVRSFLVLYPAAWLLCEWIRGWLFGGFPWLQPGYSQIDAPLAGLAPLGGVYLVTLGVLLSAGLVALASQEKRYRFPAVLGLFLLWAGSWLLQMVEWSRPAGPGMEVALLQGNISQLMHWDAEHLQKTLDIYSGMTRTAAGADLVVWPENALPLFRDSLPGGYLEQLSALAGGAALLIGMPVEDESGKYYNAVVNPRGGEYRKKHLVPFGEFIPWQAVTGNLLDLLQVPMSNFSAGPADQPLLRVRGWPLGVSICFEDVFGEEVIEALPAAAWLLNLSNDSWFGTTIAPHQHLQIARMRALESGRYLLRATNTGISAAINHRGKVEAQSGLFETSLLRVTAEPRQGATPYVVTGNSVLLLVMGVMLVAGLAPTFGKSGVAG